ncbi:MAG: class I SAM-dependent methyltransferase [Dehalococcoidia bacterium]|nr:class I SAM-dependent methyltransferase [Dehalococcoidia bacterium]
MPNNLYNKLADLYTGQGIGVKLYVKVRTKFLNLDEYSDFLPQRGVILDIGCGYGLLSNYLALSSPSRQVIGIDLDQRRIGIASKTVGERGNIGFTLKDAKECDLLPCSGAVMVDFLHHLKPAEQQLTLENIFSSLEKGGTLLIAEIDPTAEPLHTSYWVDLFLNREKSHFRKPHDWQIILARVGYKFKIIRSPIPFFARILYVCQK